MVSPRQINTLGIILNRINYGEADKILTFITPNDGKVKTIAKGVRKSRAKLAGAVELFNVSEITWVVGRGNIHTLISARLAKHYSKIVENLDRTNTAYELLRTLDKATESLPERDYFHLLDDALSALNDEKVDVDLIKLWFKMQLLKISGHAPNLKTDTNDKDLDDAKVYNFDYERMRFTPKKEGQYTANPIKFLRLGFSNHSPKVLQRVKDREETITSINQLVEVAFKTYIRI